MQNQLVLNAGSTIVPYETIAFIIYMENLKKVKI